MNVTSIPSVIGAVGTIPDGLVKRQEVLEFGGWASAMNTKEMLRSARILRKVLEPCCKLDSIERLSSYPGAKNSQGVM